MRQASVRESYGFPKAETGPAIGNRAGQSRREVAFKQPPVDRYTRRAGIAGVKRPNTCLSVLAL